MGQLTRMMKKDAELSFDQWFLARGGISPHVALIVRRTYYISM